MIGESEKMFELLSGIVHRDTQQHPFRVDLTVDSIEAIEMAGALDFGGSEFSPSGVSRLEPRKQNEGDDYGWWELDSGSYRAVFNESLSPPEEGMLLITPHAHSREAGIIADMGILVPGDEPERLFLNFQVPAAGCRIKENARFASLYLVGG